MEAVAVFYAGSLIALSLLYLGERINALIKIVDLHTSVMETGLDSIQHNLRS